MRAAGSVVTEQERRLTLPPTPPLSDEAVVIDLRHKAPPPPASLVQKVHGEAREIWIRVDLDDPDVTPVVDSASIPRAIYPLSIKRDEPLPLGLQRITLAQLDGALGGLRERSHQGVHEARIAIRRVRGVLALVAHQLGDDVAAAEDSVQRSVARRTRATRRGRVRLEQATTHAAVAIGDAAAEALTNALWMRSRHESERTIGDPQFVADLTVTLSAARARFATWPVHPGVRKPSHKRVAIAEGFASLADGFARSYRSGKAASGALLDDPSAQEVRSLRKAGRTLQHQLEVMHGAWPEVLGGLVATLEELVAVLGLEQDLGDLAWIVSTDTELAMDHRDAHVLILELERTRYRLRRRALDMARQVYVESPGAFVDRLGSYWSGWRSQRFGGGQGSAPEPAG